MPPRVPSTWTGSPGFDGRFGSQYGQVSIVATIEMGSTLSLPDRMMASLHGHLITRMGEAADIVIEAARVQLVPGHGYDTGRMHDTLVKVLVDAFETAIGGAEGVFYDLGSHEAPYWVFVEFGHITRSGNWWEGYHFLETALQASASKIRRLAFEAWEDTVMDMAAQDAVMSVVASFGGGNP